MDDVRSRARELTGIAVSGRPVRSGRTSGAWAGAGARRPSPGPGTGRRTRGRSPGTGPTRRRGAPCPATTPSHRTKLNEVLLGRLGRDFGGHEEAQPVGGRLKHPSAERVDADRRPVDLLVLGAQAANLSTPVQLIVSLDEHIPVPGLGKSGSSLLTAGLVLSLSLPLPRHGASIAAGRRPSKTIFRRLASARWPRPSTLSSSTGPPASGRWRGPGQPDRPRSARQSPQRRPRRLPPAPQPTVG